MPSAYSANAIAVSVALDSAKMLKGLKGINTNLASVGKIGAAAFVGLAAGITKAGMAASDHVMRLELIQNKAKTVFGDQQSLIRSWSQETAASFGLTAINLEGMSAGFADLLIPMEFTRETAAQMTMDVVGLAGAMSEWSNGTRTVEDTTRILARAMLGEREMLKDLGVDIRELDIKQRLMAKGQEELTGNMLKQARATATMELIFERSKDAQAGFAEGSDTLIRKTRIMQAGLEEVAQKILLALTPAFKDIVEVINSDFIPFIEEKVEPALVKLAEDFAERLPEAIEMLDDTLRVLKVPVKMLVDAFGLLHDFIVGFGVALKEPIFQAGLLAAAAGTLALVLPVLAAKFAAVGIAVNLALGPIGAFNLALGAISAVAGVGALLFLGKKEKADRKIAKTTEMTTEQQERFNKKLEKGTAKFHELARASDKELMPTLEDQRKILEGLDQGYVDFDESFYNAQISADNFANSLKNLTAEQYATAVASEILSNSAGQDMIQFDEMYNRAVKNLRMFLSPDQEGSIEALKRQLMKEAGFDSVDYISPGKRNGGSGSGGSESDFAGYELQTFHTPPPHAKPKDHKLSSINWDEVARGMAHFELNLDAFMEPISKITTNIGKIGVTARTVGPNIAGPKTAAEAIDETFIRIMEEYKLPQHAKESLAAIMKAQAIEQGIEKFGPVLRGNLPEIRPPVNEPGTPGFDPKKYLDDHAKKVASETPQNVTNYNITGFVDEDMMHQIAEGAVNGTAFKQPDMQNLMFGTSP
tara:strand:- start:35 stop:2314 length:2280 start_codon:yes stop_codon:yes gene_type:complete